MSVFNIKLPESDFIDIVLTREGSDINLVISLDGEKLFEFSGNTNSLKFEQSDIKTDVVKFLPPTKEKFTSVLKSTSNVDYYNRVTSVGYDSEKTKKDCRAVLQVIANMAANSEIVRPCNITRRLKVNNITLVSVPYILKRLVEFGRLEKVIARNETNTKTLVTYVIISKIA